MARQKKEDPPKGSAPWMNTFADLMNLLLCFFVLLFSMSTVDAEKFEMVIASLQSSFSILPSGGASIGDGQMISAGVSQLELLDEYYKKQANSTDTEESEEDIKEAYEQEALDESEKMAEQVEQQAQEEGIQNQVEVDFNAQYVLITLNGALLFDSGSADIRDQKYEDNDVLSMYRALTVADYIREKTDLDPGLIKSSGRGDYVPVADNSTPEGRAINRRVEVKIYNSYNSPAQGE